MCSVLMLFSSDLFSATLQSAQKLFNAGNFEQAKTEFKIVLSNTQNKSDALFYLAKIALIQNDADEAADLIKKARKLTPNNAEIQFFYGVVNGQIAQDASIFTALGYAKKTRKGFSKAVELAPDVIKYRQALMSYHLAAPGIAGGDKDIALEQAQAIKALDLKKGIMALASVYSATEDDKAMNTLYQTMPNTLKNDPDVNFLKGLYFQTKEQYQRAIEIFRQVVTQAGDIGIFQESKFNAIYQIGRSSVLAKAFFEEGIQNLTTYINQAPTEKNLLSKSWAKFRRANLYELQGKKSKARSIYKQLKATVKDKSLIKAIKKAL